MQARQTNVIIALVGPKRVGKDTLADALLVQAEQVFRLDCALTLHTARGSFAQRLRVAATRAYGLETTREGLFWNDKLKGVPQPLLNGLTPRDVLIHLGAAMRVIDSDIWCRGGFDDIAYRLRDNLQLVNIGVITDMRFPNELDYGKAWCARNGWRLLTVGVFRDAAPAPGLDSADQEACELRNRCDVRVMNNGDLRAVYNIARSLLLDLNEDHHLSQTSLHEETLP